MFLRLLQEFVFPRCCAGCGVEIEAGFLCRECRKGLLQMRFFPPVDALDGGVFFFTYESYIKDAIHKIKFLGDKNLPYALSEEVEMLLTEQGIVTKFLSEAGRIQYYAENDYRERKMFHPFRKGRSHAKEAAWLWSGIPTDPERLRRRGFDIPEILFAKEAKKYGGIWEQTLCRTRKTVPMYGLSPDERRRNLQDCFAVTRNVCGKSIMLVDDIFTTGTTFSAAAGALKCAGAVTVTGLAFCGSIENLT